MKVLVAVASKHGSTRDIADVVAEELQARGFLADVQAVTDDPDPRDYGAVVLGSAIYMGRWLAEARDWATRHEPTLEHMPLWLFSSGPIGDPPQPTEEPADPVQLAAVTGARGHTVFAGKLDPSTLGLGERLVTRIVHAPYGDYRDFAAIHAWAQEIATELDAVRVT